MPGTLVGIPEMIENANAMSKLLHRILYVLVASSMMAPALAESKKIFSADFGYAEDRNRDGWPDVWQRHTDRDHPRFNKMGIAARSEIPSEDLKVIRRTLAQWMLAWEQRRLPGDIIPESIPPSIDAFLESTVADTCLEIVMNGRSARVESPSFPIDSRNAYRVQMQIMAEMIDPYQVQASVHWLDASGAQISEQPMSPVTRSSDWQLIRIQETSSIPSEAKFCKIRISVTPLNSQSIQTIVRCDRIRVERIPRIELEVEPSSRIVSVDQGFKVTCKLNEVNPEKTRIQLLARDHEGNDVWQRTNELESSAHDSAEVTATSWDLALAEAGFYTLSVRVLEDTSLQSHKESGLIVLAREKSSTMAANPRIGWSLPTLGSTISLAQLPKLVEFAKIGGIKFSVWLAEPNNASSRPIGWLVENLATKGIKCVGVIDAPGPEGQAKFPDKQGESLAALLDFPQIWQPMYEPIWRRTSLFLTQFQIGWDREASIGMHSNWLSNVTSLIKQVRTVGAEAKLTLPWNAFSQPPETTTGTSMPPWNRVISFSNPGLTDTEIGAMSQDATTEPNARWLSIDPLDRDRYGLEDRVRDLTKRLVAVHQYQWEMAWLSDPTHPQLAVLDAQGGPDELLLPFVRMTDALNGSEDFLAISLNEHVAGTLFRVGNEERGIIYATKPIDTLLCLGDQWTAKDVWGRDVPSVVRLQGDVASRQIALGRWPVLLSKVDRTLAQWQVNVGIENPTIENRIGQSEPLRVRLENPEPHAVAGTLEVIAPMLLQDDRVSVKFTAQASTSSFVDVPMRLRYDASQSMEPIDIVVTLNEKPERQFLVQRPVQVGLKDFQLETQSRIDERGNAIIELEMMNLSDQVANFECTLVLPGRPREKFQIIRLEKRFHRPIFIANGAELRGQSILLRCEEIRTGRVLNHRIEIR